MRKILFSIIFIIFFESNVYSTTYYVSTSGNNSNSCATAQSGGASAKRNVINGVGCMSANDTLIIQDGTYSDTADMLGANPGGSPIGSIPSGTGSSWTVIKAENYLGAILDGVTTGYAVVWFAANRVQIEGLHIKNSGGASIRVDGNYNRVISCASEEAVSAHFGTHGDYNVVEDSFGWGRTTYALWNDGSYNVFRRCVVRRDAHCNIQAGGNWYGSFCTYQKSHSFFQNCISVDAEMHQGCEAETHPDWSGEIFTANGDALDFNVVGSIMLNSEDDSLILWPDETGGTFVWNNNVSIPNDTSVSGFFTMGGNIVITNSLIAGVATALDTLTSGSVTNSILLNNTTAETSSTITHTYNDYYGNGSIGWTPGATEKTYNPETNGLLYPVRVESSSNLENDGSGSQIGPNITKRIGTATTTSYGNSVSLLYYGQAGWDTVTNDDLWPFPNEDTIKTKMQAYNLHGANGDRGFASSTAVQQDGSTPVTLTSYIWEYLGNQIPAEIYGTEEVSHGSAALGGNSSFTFGGNGSITIY